jgi:purine nucleosidase
MTAMQVVLDCDPGVDDAMAILYGLAAPEIEIVAIGTVWGNVSVETTTANALRLVEIGGRPETPVAMGARKSLIGPPPGFAGHIHGEDGAGNTFLPEAAGRATGETAAAQIVRLGRERPGELSLVAVGPLTNLALALGLDPGIAGLYREVVVMGGAFLVPGNIYPFGEANIANDPEAAQVVLDAGWPLTMVGLDVTEKSRVTEGMLEGLRDSGSAAGIHLHRISGVYLSAYEARYGMRETPMHDALALGIAADRSLVRRARRVQVDVELTGTHTRGMTVADLRAWADPEVGNANVVLEADGEGFVRRWLGVLGGD